VPKSIDVVYVSRMSAAATNLRSASRAPGPQTSNAAEFPCMPFGSGGLQLNNDDSVCCLDRLNVRYSTVHSFNTHMLGASTLVQQEINRQGSCVGLDSSPTNYSADLLDSSIDYVVGPFSGMPRSYSSSDATPVRGYKDILLFLALEDVEQQSAATTLMQGGRRLRFFVGMAHMRPSASSTRLDVSVTQVEISTEITKTHMITTPLRSTAASSFVRDVSVSLSEVKHGTDAQLLFVPSMFAPLPSIPSSTKFATISLTVPGTVTVDDVSGGIIAPASLVLGVGHSRTTSQPLPSPCTHMYTNGRKQAIDVIVEQQGWCAGVDTLCATQGPVLIGLDGGTVQFSMPLPDSVWNYTSLMHSNSFLATYLFLDFMVVVHDKKTGKRITSNLQTRTELKTGNILGRCEQQHFQSSIEDMIEIDMFLGLAGSESSFSTSLLQRLDITHPHRRDGGRAGTNVSSSVVPATTPPQSRGAATVMQRDISSKESNVMTVLFKGNPQLFENQYAQEYTLAVEDIISLHFLNDQKHALVQQLIADGLAFTTEHVLFDNRNARTVMKLEPTRALLAYCPFQAKRGTYGCNARREIKQRVLEFQTNSITSITGRLDEDAQSVHLRAGLWSQQLLGGSEYARQLGYNHSKLMSDKNSLNARYRPGFMIAPTIPWRQAEMDALTERVDSALQLAQHMITTILVSLDTNTAQLFDAKVQLTLPSMLPLSRQQVIDNQLVITTAYAKGANLDATNIFIDISSIFQRAIAPGARRRRRSLLDFSGPSTVAVDHVISDFNIVAGFPTANEDDAIREATLFAAAIARPDSLQARLVMQTVNDALTRKIRFYPRPSTMFNAQQVMQPPTSRGVCANNAAWEIQATVLLGIDIGSAFGLPKVGFLSCQGRRVRLPNMDGSFSELATVAATAAMPVRGPQQDSDWNMVPRSYVVEATGAQANGWLWWDFCAAPPRLAVAQDAAFLSAWQQIRTEAASHCCACETSPRIPGTSRPYQHKYTWPLRLDNESIYDMYTGTFYALGSSHVAVGGSGIFKLNPQLRNFRLQHGASVVQFELENSPTLPPLPWDIDENGHTLSPSCPAAHWMKTRFGCHMCPIHTYRQADSIRFPNTAAQAHLRGGQCTPCPPFSVAGYLQTSIADCVCTKGYYRDHILSICVPCPPNTYKDTHSNENTCTPCADGLQSRSASVDVAKCVQPLSVGDFNRAVHVYTTVLGLLYYQTPVEPSWRFPPAAHQDQTMLCVLVSGEPMGVSLDCGCGIYEGVYADSPVTYSTQANTLRSIRMTSNTNHRILSFHGPAAAANRLLLVVTPGLGVNFFVDSLDRDDLKSRVKQISLFPRPGYMGPSPPGFVEQILNGMRWVRGISVTTTLRVHIANSDLSLVNRGNDVYMVTFLSSKLLSIDRGSVDWQWIVCGRKTIAGDASSGSTYAFCRDEPDPDNPTEANSANPRVLDGSITRLNGNRCCDSCFDEYDWMPDCRQANTNPRMNRLYDNTIEWVPFLNTQPPNGTAAFFLYTFFTTGESAACTMHNCNEAAVYRNMLLHLATEKTTEWDNTIDFLPGTSIVYQVPLLATQDGTRTPLYRHALGFVEMNPRHTTSSLGSSRRGQSDLDKMYSGHSCRPTNASSLECTTSGPTSSSVTIQYNNVYQPDIESWTEQTQILPYVHNDLFAATVEVEYCCEVRCSCGVLLVSPSRVACFLGNSWKRELLSSSMHMQHYAQC